MVVKKLWKDQFSQILKKWKILKIKELGKWKTEKNFIHGTLERKREREK